MHSAGRKSTGLTANAARSRFLARWAHSIGVASVLLGLLLTVLSPGALALALPGGTGPAPGATDPPNATTVDERDEENHNEDLTIVVTASRIPQELLDVPVSVEVLDGATLAQAGVETLGEALRLAAGISVRQTGARSGIEQMSIRGSSAEQVLILVDGMPVASPQGSLNLALVPIAHVERIEIVKGPGSSLYGANAVGGVVNVITRPAADLEGWELRVEGAPGDLALQGAFGGTWQETHYRINGGYIRSEGDRPNSEYTEYRFGGRVDHELSPSSEVSLRFEWLSADAGVPGSTFWPTPDAFQTDRHAWVDLSYLQDLDFGQLEATLYQRTYRRTYGDTFGTSRHDGSTLGGEVQTDIPLGAGVLTLGASGRTERVKSTDLADDEKSAVSGALFAQVVQDVTERVSVTLGVRADAHSSYPAPLSPRAGIRVALGPGATLRASAGRSFRAPTFDDLYWALGGNPNLLPEDGWSYEVGLRQEFGSVSVDVAAFRREIDNLIRWADPDNDFIWTPENIASSRTDGLEATLAATLGRGVTASLHWTALAATDLTTGDPIPYIPEHEGGATLHYIRERISAYVSVQHRGDRPDGSGNALPAYTVVNGKLSYALGEGLEVYLEGKNLFDEAYEELPGYPLPGRVVRFGAVYTY